MQSYFATLQNTTGTFSVHALFTQIDASPSCNPTIISAWVGDGPVRTASEP
jgi:hypothetical protein